MRALAINIRAGGTAANVKALLARIERHEPDIVVVCEFRDTNTGAAIQTELGRLGFGHQAATTGHKGNGVLVAAVHTFTGIVNPFGLDDDEYPNAVLQANFANLRIYGVYLPGQDRKRAHLRCLAAAAESNPEANLLCIGDLNSGRDATDIELNLRTGKLLDRFSTADLYAELERHWTEAWQHIHPDEHEFSWYPFRRDTDYQSNNGWRIDKALISKPLVPKLLSAEYDHQFRLDRLTDHSAIIVDLNLDIAG